MSVRIRYVSGDYGIGPTGVRPRRVGGRRSRGAVTSGRGGERAYEVAVVTSERRHERRVAALVLAGGTLVSLEHDGIPREGVGVGVAGAARALANLVEHVRPVPDALTLYTERGVPADDALAAAPADVRDALDGTRVRGSERTSPFSEELLGAFAEETTPNTRTRFHANPWLYAEPIRLVSDASVLYDANDDALSSSVGWYALDDRNTIVAMEARTVDDPDPNAAEYRAAGEAVAFARGIDAEYVQVVVDSEAVTRRIDPRRTRSAVETTGLLDGFDRADVVRVSSRQNRLADALAAFGHRRGFSGRADACRAEEHSPDEPRCLGRTVDGSRCRNRVRTPGATCHLHPRRREYC